MRGSTIVRCRLLACAATSVIALAPVPALAQVQTFQFDIPAQSLDGGLRAFARATHQQVLFDGGLVRGKRSQGVSGSHTAEDALNVLLEGTGLAANRTSGGAYVIKLGNAPAAGETAAPLGEHVTPSAAPGSEAAERAIVVTGTHVRGETPASPVIIRTAEDFMNSGYKTTTQVMQSIPQNFGGGLSPGVIGTTGGSAGWFYGASGADLRALGPNATLVLLDGHRISHIGINDAYDLSTIPLNAVDHVEILTDGASAIYGSDAIAGVVNFVLKKDFQGVQVDLTGGFPTQGGGNTYRASMILGQTWSGGNLLLSYERAIQDSLLSSDRAFSRLAPSPNDISPRIDTNNLGFSINQRIRSDLSASVEGTFSWRNFDEINTSSFSTYGDHARSANCTLNAGLIYNVKKWQFGVSGTVSGDNTTAVVNYYLPGSTSSSSQLLSVPTLARNTDKALDFVADGTLAELPAGPIRVAAGASYRQQSFRSDAIIGNATRRDISIYAELEMPLVAPDERRIMLDKLEVTAAARFDHYSDFGGTFNPKFGVIYNAAPDLQFKSTWSTAFRAPSLFNLYDPNTAFMFDLPDPTSGRGTTPSIILAGGNKSLRPETSQSWTVTASYRPGWLAGLQMTGTYFNYLFKDRILFPINGSAFFALTNPAYAGFVTRGPSPAAVSDFVDMAPSLTNYSAEVYSPAVVGALVNDTYQNVSRYFAKGVDMHLSYSTRLGQGKLNLEASATYLNLRERPTPDSDAVQLSGFVFNPPRWKGRGGVVYDQSHFGAALFLNHMSRLLVLGGNDLRSYTTTDLQAHYAFGRPGASLPALTVQVAVFNVFDRKPPLLAPAYAPYPGINMDTSNYSPVGRVLQASLTARW